MAVELAQIEAFLAVAEELRFGRAAALLGIDAAQVTRRVQSLERLVGEPLLERTSRRVRLTPAGVRLRDDIAPAFHLLNAVEDAKRRATGITGEVVLGVTATTEGAEVDALVASFEAAHPDCRVRIAEVDILDQQDRLVTGDIDILVGWEALARDGMFPGPTIGYRDRCVAVGVSHPLAGSPSISIDELADHTVTNWRNPPVLDGVSEAFNPASTPSGHPIPRDSQQVQTAAEIASRVARGRVVHPTVDGIAMFTGHHGIELIPLTGLPPLGLHLFRRTDLANPAAAALIAHASRHGHTGETPRPA